MSYKIMTLTESEYISVSPRLITCVSQFHGNLELLKSPLHGFRESVTKVCTRTDISDMNLYLMEDFESSSDPGVAET